MRTVLKSPPIRQLHFLGEEHRTPSPAYTHPMNIFEHLHPVFLIPRSAVFHSHESRALLGVVKNIHRPATKLRGYAPSHIKRGYFQTNDSPHRIGSTTLRLGWDLTNLWLKQVVAQSIQGLYGGLSKIVGQSDKHIWIPFK